MPRTTHLLWVVVSLGAMPVLVHAQGVPPRPMESFPDRLQARIEIRDRALRNLPKSVNGFSLEYVIRNLNIWNPGQKVRVAFNGGGTALQQDIATVAAGWLAQGGNVALDFGWNPATGKYRTWSAADGDYAAEIRISFDQAGYWSLVGRDSINPAVARPAEASMNFGGFPIQLPGDWKAVIRHEFGHAFGFEHEHQNPIGGCDEDFRWNDDPGYVPTADSNGVYGPDSVGRRPGLYTALGGAYNYWPRSKVDFNLRQLKDSQAFMLGRFDAKSIMKYFFEDWMFVKGKDSHCYNDENLDFSPDDLKGFMAAYRPPDATTSDLLTHRKEWLNTVITTDKLPSPVIKGFQLQLDQMK